MTPQFLVVGLGNPGEQYAYTRHNIGFRVVDHLASDQWETKKGHQSLESNVTIHDKIILLMKPQTFMNESGVAVASVLQYYTCSPSQLMVVHDDVDLPLGEIRLQKGRGSAGHKGVESVIRRLKTNMFTRLRCGIGRPADGDIERFVLEPFLSDERSKVHVMIDQAGQRIRDHFSLPSA